MGNGPWAMGDGMAHGHEPVSRASAPSWAEVLMRTPSIAALALLLTAGPAIAQSSSDYSSTAAGGISIGKTYDDEGQIGSGPLFGARIDRRLFGNTFLEASFDNLGHDRSDRFVANGHTTLISASLIQRFGSTAAQPYVLGGMALAHHTGTAGF